MDTRNADADVIGPRGSEQVAGGEDVRQLFVQVAQLNEESNANARRFQPLTRGKKFTTVVPLFIASNTR